MSDAYDERREAIRAELAAEGMEVQDEDLIDDPEQYQGYGVLKSDAGECALEVLNRTQKANQPLVVSRRRTSVS